MKRRVTLSLDEDLADVIDKTRGDISRSRFIERMLFGAVDEKEKKVEVSGYV